MRTALILLALLATEAFGQDAPVAAAGATAAAGESTAAAASATPPAPAASGSETTGETVAAADESGATPPLPGGVKSMSGMSILGNEETPTSLVIVPWKSSQLGDGLSVTNALDERPRALDREVFMRELHYYELRSGGSE
jgi:hypothetical protein